MNRLVRVQNRWDLVLPVERGWKYLEDPNWERERIASMALNLSPTDCLFDVGTEEGDMSALFASWLTDGKIALIEPNPNVWPCIRAVWEMNGLRLPDATWVGFASAETSDASENDTGGQAPPGAWPACAYGPLRFEHGFRHLSDGTNISPQVTLDAFAAAIAGWEPTAITMDVEGGELAVLSGATRVLAEDRPLVWVSIHPQFLRHHFGQSSAEVLAFMETYDYRAVHLADDHESHWYFEPR